MNLKCKVRSCPYLLWLRIKTCYDNSRHRSVRFRAATTAAIGIGRLAVADATWFRLLRRLLFIVLLFLPIVYFLVILRSLVRKIYV